MVGSSFQMMGAATEKARLPRFSLVLGIESCCEVDDLSCLGTLENAGDLQDKVVDVLHEHDIGLVLPSSILHVIVITSAAI